MMAQSAAILFLGLIFLRDLHKIIDSKNIAAGYARRYIFGIYMDHFFL
jgi:hypothetical protein